MSLHDGRKVIAFDFDGVLHEYHGWNGGALAGPMPGMQDVVARLIAAGAHVVVHTTRKAGDIGPWLAKHYGIPQTDVHNDKWKRIDVFVDDRAWRFHPDDALSPQSLANRLMAFEPHWRQGAPA